MFEFMRGRRPDVTPAQLLATVPAVVALLVVIGVFDLAGDEHDALKWAVAWAAVLLVADAAVRIGRNVGGRRGALPPDEVEGGDALFIPFTEEELAEAERLDAEDAEVARERGGAA